MLQNKIEAPAGGGLDAKGVVRGAIMTASLGTIVRLLALGAALCGAGCAETQMRYNVLSYDNAVAQGANQQLLLNAVRASQHYPMSFTAMGQVLASPPLSASVDGAFNFSRAIGLDTYSATPKLEASAGYTTFTLDNLNYVQFMAAMRTPVPEGILDTFCKTTRWPRGLLPIIYLQKLNPTEDQIRMIDLERKRQCQISKPSDLCSVLETLIADYSDRCGSHFRDLATRLNDLRTDPNFYYNSARTFCNFARFTIIVGEIRRLRLDYCHRKHPAPGCIRAEERPALEMIAYLGELIAAQNYIDPRFEPFVIIGDSTLEGRATFDILPLFEVRRGLGGPHGAALSVVHEGELFYIPRPDFGSRREARSLQTLDLVLETVRAATLRNDLPKLQTLGVVGGKS